MRSALVWGVGVGGGLLGRQVEESPRAVKNTLTASLSNTKKQLIDLNTISGFLKFSPAGASAVLGLEDSLKGVSKASRKPPLMFGELRYAKSGSQKVLENCLLSSLLGLASYFWAIFKKSSFPACFDFGRGLSLSVNNTPLEELLKQNYLPSAH